MCGIAGVSGSNAVMKSLLITVNQLERGTQGCGCAWVRGRKIKYLKEATHPVAYMCKHVSHLPKDVNVAISHNRLPSKGRVCYENTHPFISCDKSFALIHNGHSFTHGLEMKLKWSGHRIQGETDSEMVMHLLEELLEGGRDMVEALTELHCYGFQGALLVLTREGEIYGVREGHYPIVFAEHKGEVYVASTEKALRALVGDDVEVRSLKQRQVLYVRGRKCEVIGRGIDDFFAELRRSWRGVWYDLF